jgi:hypothetical protein
VGGGSRACLSNKDLPVKMEHINREFWNRILALDEPTLPPALGNRVERGTIRGMLAGRNKMKIASNTLVTAHAEIAVFLR